MDDASDRTQGDGTPTLTLPDHNPEATIRCEGLEWSHPPNVLGLRCLDGEPPEIAVTGILGEGGMGVVSAGRQTSLDRDVAVKRPRRRSDTVATRELLREGRLTGGLQHPNIVPVHILGRDAAGTPMLVMKRIEGDTWAEALGERPDDLVAHLGVLLQVCHAIEFAHDRGVIHRDLKPANVMLGRFGEVYLVDWGIALSRAELHAGNPTTGIVGTPHYMAPEMLTGAADRIDERTDVYQLAALLYEMLTGRAPHAGPGGAAAIVVRINTTDPQLPDDAPRELADLCRRGLAREPDQRPQTAAAFREGLQEFLTHRVSMQLTDEALRQLDGLDEAEDEWAVFHAIEIALEIALREWPENLAAREALESARVDMARRTLLERDVEAAERLVADCEAPPRALVEAVIAAGIRRDRDRTDVERLRHDLDLNVEVRTRGRFAFTLGIVTASVAATFAVAEHRGELVMITAHHQIVDGALALGIILVYVLLRRAGKSEANAVNQRLWGGIVVGTIALFVHTITAPMLGIEPSGVVSHGILLGGLIFLVLAVTVDQRMAIPGVAYVTLHLVQVVHPERTFAWMVVGNLVAFCGVGVAWLRAARRST